MRKFSLFLFILVLIVLTACGTGDKEADQGEINEDDEATDEKESSSGAKPTDISGILDTTSERSPEWH